MIVVEQQLHINIFLWRNLLVFISHFQLPDLLYYQATIILFFHFLFQLPNEEQSIHSRPCSLQKPCI